MRLRNLIQAISVAAAFVALVPAGALAAKHPSSDPCSINLNIASQRIVAPEPVVATGQLVCSRPASADGQTVKLYEHAFGTHGYVIAQTATTNASGAFRITQEGVQSNSIFMVHSRGAQSQRLRVQVALQVNLNSPASGTKLTSGSKVTFSGTINPTGDSARAFLQEEVGTSNSWKTVSSAQTVSSTGAFSIEHTFATPGTVNVRVQVFNKGRDISGQSNEAAYEVV
jgi:hypothetical protein